MRIATAFIYGLIASLPSTAWSQQGASLGEILQKSENAISVLKAEADLASKKNQVQKERGEDGLSLFASAGYGRVRDVIDENRTRTFNQAIAKLGVTYPLLGSAEANNRDIHKAEGELAQARSRMEAARYLARLEMEASYARYWEAQEHLDVINSYLESESRVKRLLQLRREQDLILESEMLNLLAAYEKAKVDKRRFERMRRKAINRLNQLTGEELAAFTASRVKLKPIRDLNREQLVHSNPELQAVQATAESLQAQIEDSDWHGVNANFEVSSSLVHDQTGAQTGGGVFAGFNFSAPLSFFSARKAAIQELKAERRKALLEYREKSFAIITEAQSVKDEFEQYLQTMQFSKQRTEASGQALRERYLRSKVMESEGIEQMARDLEQYYILSNRQIEAYADAWLANIEARMFIPPKDGAFSEPAPVTGPGLGEQLSDPIRKATANLSNNSAQVDTVYTYNVAAINRAHGARFITADYNPGRDSVPQVKYQFVKGSPSISSVNNLGVYLWESETILENTQYSQAFWQGLNDLSIDRLLLSLNAVQIEAASGQDKKLEDFLNNAERNNISVELLLGEPLWIKPDQRQHLISIIEKLSRYSFSGLHLDIEPNQLYELPLNKSQFDNWLATMAAAAKASPWPVDISVHHRYFRESRYLNWQITRRLVEADINRVTLMIYNSNPKAVAGIASPILEQSPGIRFQIAQSVEQILPPKLSHFHRKPPEFEKTMADLEKLIAAKRNYSGIVIQDWQNFLRIGYESKIL